MATQYSVARKAVPLVFGILVLVALGLISQFNYLLFHTATETFSIAVAVGIFMLAWNARRFLESGFLLFLGIAYLHVGGLDLIHTLAYNGLGVFPGVGSNPATQLWIAGRYMESLSLLVAPVFMTRKLKFPSLIIACFTLCVAAVLISIFYSGDLSPHWFRFPRCYVEGQGLTTFKVNSEYIICGILLASLVVLIGRRKAIDALVVKLISASILMTILSEIFFTLYRDVYGYANMLGHLIKIVSFYLIYKALIATGLSKPFKVLFHDLKLREQKVQETRKYLRAVLEQAADALFLIEPSGKFVDVNQRACEALGYRREELLALSVPQIDPVFPQAKFTEFYRTLDMGIPVTIDAIHKRKDGSTFPVEIRTVLIEISNKSHLLSLARDITDRRRTEEEIYNLAKFPSENPSPVLRISQSGEILYSNKASAPLLKAWQSDREPFISDTWLQPVRDALASGQSQRKDFPCEEKIFSITFAPVANAGYVNVYALDVSVRRRAEEDIYNLAKFPCVNPCPVLRISKFGEILYGNKASAPLLKAWQSDREPFMADTWLQPVRDALESGQSQRKDFPCEGKVFSITFAPVADAGYVNVYALDVSERRRAEESLRQAHDELEMRVQQRTEELAHSVRSLEEEVQIRRQLEAEVQQISEFERKRIGRDLHDGLGQMLSGISCLSELLSRRLKDKDMDEAKEAAKIERTAIDSLKLTRSLVRGLSPLPERPDGLMMALQDLASYTESMFEIRCVFECNEAVPLNDHIIATQLFRIAQEAVTNATRHGMARNIALGLSQSDNQLVMTVTDDGIGIPKEAPEVRGLGLRTMQYRAASISARLDVAQGPERGTVVRCCVPVGKLQK